MDITDLNRKHPEFKGFYPRYGVVRKTGFESAQETNLTWSSTMCVCHFRHFRKMKSKSYPGKETMVAPVRIELNIAGVKGRCPFPLDEGVMSLLLRFWSRKSGKCLIYENLIDPDITDAGKSDKVVHCRQCFPLLPLINCLRGRKPEHYLEISYRNTGMLSDLHNICTCFYHINNRNLIHFIFLLIPTGPEQNPAYSALKL